MACFSTAGHRLWILHWTVLFAPVAKKPRGRRHGAAGESMLRAIMAAIACFRRIEGVDGVRSTPRVANRHAAGDVVLGKHGLGPPQAGANPGRLRRVRLGLDMRVIVLSISRSALHARPLRPR